MKVNASRLAVIVAALFSAASLAWAFAPGSANNLSATPQQSTCSCHNSFPLNSGPGSVGITLTPEFPFPGDTVEVQISLEQAGQIRWGFEVTGIDVGGSATPLDFILTDTSRTLLSGDSSAMYVTNSLTATDSGVADVAPGWSFKWAVPNFLDLMVDLYVAGCAANGDGLPTGDYIYTDSLQVRVSIDYFLTTGDVNEDGIITSADIIYLVAYVFKGGNEPIPCAAVGDVNCNGVITSADILYLVGYVFKGGSAPCDVLMLIPDTWNCP